MTINVDSTLVEHPTCYTIGSGASTAYRGVVAVLANLANAAGSGAGAAVTVPIAITAGPGLPTSLNYTVHITASQPCFASWSSKTATGFNVVLTPKDGSTTLGAGTFDVLIRWVQ